MANRDKLDDRQKRKSINTRSSLLSSAGNRHQGDALQSLWKNSPPEVGELQTRISLLHEELESERRARRTLEKVFIFLASFVCVCEISKEGDDQPFLKFLFFVSYIKNI